MTHNNLFNRLESNAFATGWNKNNALVAVSQGLLQRFNRDEARAVIAHEIGHHVQNLTSIFLYFGFLLTGCK